MPGDETASEARGSPLVSSKCDGFQPVSDVSVDMGDFASDKSTGTGARVDRAPAAQAPLKKTPSGETDKPTQKKDLFKGSFGSGVSSSKMKPEAQVKTVVLVRPLV